MTHKQVISHSHSKRDALPARIAENTVLTIAVSLPNSGQSDATMKMKSQSSDEFRFWLGARRLFLTASAFFLATSACLAHVGTLPPSLKEVQVPQVPGLVDGANPIVVDRQKAIVLGKALFWDTNVGSDGMACGSCHFHASADNRTKNQFSPGHAHLPKKPTDPNGFDPNDPRGTNLSNYQLKRSDFPLYFNATMGDTYNAVASSGTFSGKFVKVNATGDSRDTCEPFSGDQLDNTFNVNGIHTRRVEPRNAMAFNNSVLSDRMFWDGRANHTFNGVTPFGPRDPNAYIWVADGGAVWKTRLELENASMASLATGPALSEFEMSCKGRTFPDIARKLMKRRPLENQAIHPEDSALAGLRDGSGKGLNLTYEELIHQSFAPRYWSAGVHPLFGAPGYSPEEGFSQVEVNFSMIFGLAIQLYAETQISNDTRFDRSNITSSNGQFLNSDESAPPENKLTTQELDGLKLFNDLHCILCHTGPSFTLATNRKTFYVDNDVDNRQMINRVLNTDSRPLLLDTGFMNNGSVPETDDPGLAGVDDFGKKLSFSDSYKAYLSSDSNQIFEPLPLVEACSLTLAFTSDYKNELRDDTLSPPGIGNCTGTKATTAKIPTLEAAQKDSSRLGLTPAVFKIPQLYNIELTGPYFHNGGAATLSEVLDQYMREQPAGNGGNFTNSGSTFTLLPRSLSQQEKNAVIAFLKTLTDERVRNEAAPFDHPEVFVPDGHETQGDGTLARDPSQPELAKDLMLHVPAVGSNGRSAQGLPPLQSFEEILQQP